jgi:phosphate transport system protein
MVTRKDFDQGLENLNQLIVAMGHFVEEGIGAGMHALQDGDVLTAQRIVDQDPVLNDMEAQVMNIGSTLIATQQPVAKDLRRILVSFKIANDLERMGDLVVDLAKVVIRLNGEKLIKPLIDLPRMGAIVQTMTEEAIQAFINEDVNLAQKMAHSDDQVDALYGQIVRELFAMMMENTHVIKQANQLSFVARYMERFGDHATNIGESVVYLVTNTRPDLNR